MEGKQWRVLEFYSGIGGMRYSLARAGIDGEVVEAFDINDVANDVYEHNFGHRPYQGNIQSLTSADLDKYGADAWLLSPPCQPYTRQGLQKHSADARASSFINIMELLPQMKKPPSMLFVENVVGFETSDTHEHLMRIFAENGFAAQEFILNPLQFGVPYSRPRYFCLAKRKPFHFREPPFSGQSLQCPSPLGIHEIFGSVDKDCHLMTECKPIKCFLESSYACADHQEAAEDTPHCNSFDEYTVPLSLIERWGSAMDIVSPDSKRCCCFTKSYYRYVKGTGSLLANVQQPIDNPKVLVLKELGLRYFTPKEVANLHSFPEDFSFPSHVNLRQRYALLGNSLSVAVVAPLLQYLFS